MDGGKIFFSEHGRRTVAGRRNAFPGLLFLSWMVAGWGGGIFGTLVYGFSNKYNYQVKKHYKFLLPICPQAFKGLRIVQLSDIHSGSFNEQGAQCKKA